MTDEIAIQAISKMEAFDFHNEVCEKKELLGHLDYYLMAKYLFDCKKYDDAILNLNKAIELNPKQKWYYYYKGYAEKEISIIETYSIFVPEFKIAIADLRKSLELDDQFIPALFQLAEIYRIDEKYSLALECYLKCINLNREFDCYYQLWFCYYTVNMLAEASNILDTYINVFADNIMYYYCMSLTMMKKDSYGFANKYFKIYIKRKGILNEDEFDNYQILLCKRFCSMLKKAKIFNLNGNYKSALKIYGYIFENNVYLKEENLFYYFSSVLECSADDLLLKYSFAPNLMYFNSEIKLKIVNSSSILTFGQYKGRFIRDIVLYNPSYIIWCVINLSSFIIDMELLANTNLRSEINLKVAIEKNIQKLIIFENVYYENKFNAINYLANDFEESGDCSKYGGPCGYDDDTIDSAFEGCPDLVWNVE